MNKYKRYWELNRKDNVQYGHKDPIKIVVFIIVVFVLLTIVAIIV